MTCGKSNLGVGYAQLAGRSSSLPGCVENYEAFQTSKNMSVSSGWSSFSLSDTTPTDSSLSTRSSSLSLARPLSATPPLTLNDIQVSTLTADWCILQLFLTLASGWDWKIVSCIDDARRQQKILCKMCEKTAHLHTYTHINIYRCMRV